MAKVYRAGQVTAALFSSKKSVSAAGSLADLFTGTRVPAGGLVLPEETRDITAVKRLNDTPVDTASPAPKKKKKKKDQDAPEAEEFPFEHEALIQKKKEEKEILNKKKKKTSLERKKEDDDAAKRPRRNRKREKGADTRTIFVGNCPLSADKKDLKKLFKEYGDIETIRFRCAPAADPNLPRRAIVITKNFNEKCKSYIAYIVFKEEDSAKKAMEKNGFVLDGLHLRVDIASASSKADKKRSVFIGNLPFDVQEEEIRSHFSDCGEIVNVRIVRDRQTSLGKGIAYVNFESKDSVGLALKLNNSQFETRQLRVMACSNKAKEKQSKLMKEKKKDGSKKNNPKFTPDPNKKKLSFAPSNASAANFKAKFLAKKEKRLRKLKKKSSGKKMDAVTAVLGEAPASATVKQGRKPKKSGMKKPGGMKKPSGKPGGDSGFNKRSKNFKGKGGKHKITSRSKGFKQGKKVGRNKF